MYGISREIRTKLKKYSREHYLKKFNKRKAEEFLLKLYPDKPIYNEFHDMSFETTLPGSVCSEYRSGGPEYIDSNKRVRDTAFEQLIKYISLLRFGRPKMTKTITKFKDYYFDGSVEIPVIEVSRVYERKCTKIYPVSFCWFEKHLYTRRCV